MNAVRVACALASLALLGATHDPLAGRIAGPAVDCIDLSRMTGPVIDGHAILYRQSLARIWRTEPKGTCGALRRDVRLITEVYGRRVCNDDRFQVLPRDSVIPSAYCRFGPFVPYDKPRNGSAQ